MGSQGTLSSRMSCAEDKLLSGSLDQWPCFAQPPREMVIGSQGLQITAVVACKVVAGSGQISGWC